MAARELAVYEPPTHPPYPSQCPSNLRGATMFPESAKRTPPGAEGPGRSPLDSEVRDMVNAITHRISHLHKAEGTGQHHREPEEEEEEHGVRIITLAGTNMGATMRSELLGSKSSSQPANTLYAAARRGGDEDEDDHDEDEDDSEAGTFVNSNFQAVNNSIMMSSSYNTNDPGVHLDISDVFGPPRTHHGLGMDKHPMRRHQWKRKDKAARSD